MSRLKALNPDEATGKTKELFDAVQSKMGMVPNMMRTMGNSVSVLSGYLSFSGAVSSSSLGPKLGELISLTVANFDGCNYCNTAHTFVGGKIGLDKQSMDLARSAVSHDNKNNAALQFVKAILETKGKVSNTEFEKVKEAGFNDAQIAEIVAAVALSIFTNYFNNIADTEIDFPKIELI